MFGRISVQFTLVKNSFTGDIEVKTKALLRSKASLQNFKKGYGSMFVKINHDIKLETLQFLAEVVYDKIEELDEKNSLTINDLPAQFVKGKRKDGSVYYCILVTLGNDEYPMVRAFYLNDMQVIRLENKFKSPYQFTESELNEDQISSHESVEDDDENAE